MDRSQTRPGTTVFTYDANSHLVAVGDTTNANNNRSYVNDLSGTALFASQTGHTQRQLVVNGEMLGRYGQMVDADNPRDTHGNPIFTSSVDFSFGYQPISGNYPSASPGTYAVVAGDTLQGIAKAPTVTAPCGAARSAGRSGASHLLACLLAQPLIIDDRIAMLMLRAVRPAS